MTAGILLITSNPNKRQEAERLLDLPVESLAADLTEIQESSLEAITRHKLLEARRLAGDRPVLVEDVALGFDALGGFPGPYIRWLLECGGGEALATIAAALDSPAAVARCCVGYWSGSRAHLFIGEQPGTILTSPRGERRFGWDPWFVPAGSSISYAEMSPQEKDRCSHRARAYSQLRRHLSQDQ